MLPPNMGPIDYFKGKQLEKWQVQHFLPEAVRKPSGAKCPPWTQRKEHPHGGRWAPSRSQTDRSHQVTLTHTLCPTAFSTTSVFTKANVKVFNGHCFFTCSFPSEGSNGTENCNKFVCFLLLIFVSLIFRPRQRLRVRRDGGNRGWDGWMASLTQQTWVWASSRGWWRTGKPGVLQSIGPQRVRHDWATEQWQPGTQNGQGNSFPPVS